MPRKRAPKKAPAFTKLYATWPALLHEAGANATEWAVLVALAQHPCKNGTLSRPVADYGAGSIGLASATGCSETQVRKALASLTRKCFTGKGGKRTPILTKVAGGHRGKTAVFRCNLPKWPRAGRAEGDQTEQGADQPTEGARESVPEREPNGAEKGSQSVSSCVPNQEPHLEKGEGAAKPATPPTWFR